MLVVKPSGAKSWVLRYQIAGKRRDMGLGPWPDVSLAMAREKALEARRSIALALDPLDEKRKAKALTLRDAGQALIEMKRSGWRNEKHAAQWSSTLGQYAFPRLGDLDVRKISTDHVLEVLTPIWTTKPETASRVRQRIEAVLDYARAIGARDGDDLVAGGGISTACCLRPRRCGLLPIMRRSTGGDGGLHGGTCQT